MNNPFTSDATKRPRASNKPREFFQCHCHVMGKCNLHIFRRHLYKRPTANELITQMSRSRCAATTFDFIQSIHSSNGQFHARSTWRGTHNIVRFPLYASLFRVHCALFASISLIYYQKREKT